MTDPDNGKLPWFPLYVADHQRDTRHLSIAARGAWTDILCAMHASQDRGVVIFNRLKLARFLGVQVEQVDATLAELRDPHNATGGPVCDFDDLADGNFKLTCRRMVRDEQRRQTNRRNGQRGGNPKLTQSRLTESVNRLSNPPPTGGLTLESESESESEIGDESPSPSSRPAASLPPALDGTNVDGPGAFKNATGQRPASTPPRKCDTHSPGSATPRADSPRRAPPKRRARVLSDEQNSVREAFIEWWCSDAYRSRTGVVYAFQAEARRNGAAVKKILESVSYGLAEAQALAARYLQSDANFDVVRNWPLFGLAEQLTKWTNTANGARIVATSKGTDGRFNHRRPDADVRPIQPGGSALRELAKRNALA